MKIILISLFLICSVLCQSDTKNVQSVQTCIDSIVDLEKILNKFYTLVKQGKFNDATALLPEIKEKMQKVDDECDPDIVRPKLKVNNFNCLVAIYDFIDNCDDFFYYITIGDFDEAAKLIPEMKKHMDNIDFYCSP